MLRHIPLSLALIICFITILPLNSGGDGIPVVNVSAHTHLWETSQIAVIDVDVINKTQEINLYISVISPRGSNLTLAIPLLTKPWSISYSKITDREFSDNYEIGDIKSKANEISKSGKNLLISYGAVVLGGPLIGIMVSSVKISGAGSWSAPSGQETQMFVYNISSEENLEELYSSLNITPSDYAKRAIEKYGHEYILVFSSYAPPPLNSTEMSYLEKNESNALNDVIDYITTHPNKTFSRGYYYHGYIYKFPLGLRNIIDNRTRTEKGRNLLVKYVLISYGLLPTKGYEIKMKMPLLEGKSAYFPLGTSSLWSNEVRATVVFRFSKDYYTPLEGGTYLEYGGKSIIFVNATNADYDLVGEVEPVPIFLKILYEIEVHSIAYGAILGEISLFVVVAIFMWRYRKDIFGLKPLLVGLAILILSIFPTYFITLFIAFVFIFLTAIILMIWYDAKYYRSSEKSKWWEFSLTAYFIAFSLGLLFLGLVFYWEKSGNIKK